MSGLLANPRVDVVAHLDGTFHSDSTLHGAMAQLGIRRLVIYRDNATDVQPRTPSVSWSIGRCEQPLRHGSCLTAGYEQSVKWRGCWGDLLEQVLH